jgi:hypothetical protein
LQISCNQIVCIYIYARRKSSNQGDRNMNNLAPRYLTPYVLIGSIAVVAAVLFGLRSALRLAGLPGRNRRYALWSVSALLLAWFFGALILSWIGFYQGARVPTLQYGLVTPIVVGVVLFWKLPVFKRAVDSVPQRWIVSVQVFRVLGLIFLVLFAEKRLPGTFAWPAGVGDVIVGLLAPVVGIAYVRGSRTSAGLLRAWNLFGLTDLVVAVTTGFLTSPSPLQMLAFDRPNQLISSFPMVMIPVFLVPLAVLLHLASLEKLRQTENGPRARYSVLAHGQG